MINTCDNDNDNDYNISDGDDGYDNCNDDSDDDDNHNIEELWHYAPSAFLTLSNKPKCNSVSCDCDNSIDYN